MAEVIEIREWDADSFHRRVLEMESQGYVARRESYRVIPEMNPETGRIIHLFVMEMHKSGAEPH
ncbi:MAG TPA: hypothetical protein VGQ71_08525 [Terriglobales bacterium]|nr:hypothetical protein [Terriglobales bacterium]